jgi:hypothetical protein
VFLPQGDQMSLWKKSPKMYLTQPIFCHLFVQP